MYIAWSWALTHHLMKAVGKYKKIYMQNVIFTDLKEVTLFFYVYISCVCIHFLSIMFHCPRELEGYRCVKFVYSSKSMYSLSKVRLEVFSLMSTYEYNDLFFVFLLM